MNTLYFGSEYPAYGDAVAEEMAMLLLHHDVYTSSSIVVTAVQTLMFEKIVSPNTTQIMYKNICVPITEKGDIYDWPKGFCDVMRKLFYRRFGV
jgi:hypothetical protein